MTTQLKGPLKRELTIGKDKDGNFVRMIEKKVFDGHADSYADQCNMKR